MSREYKITCTPLKGSELAQMLRQLPSPIHRPQMVEIYNYRVEDDGYYFIDHLVARKTAAVGLQVFIDAALSSANSVTIRSHPASCSFAASASSDSPAPSLRRRTCGPTRFRVVAGIAPNWEHEANRRIAE